MRARLAVSDAGQCLLSVLFLQDLALCAQARLPFRPGRLACGLSLYCADANEGVLYALDRQNLCVQRAFSAGPEIEGLALAKGGERLLALCGGSDSLLALDTRLGRLLGMTRVGVRPCALVTDPRGRLAAVAGGASEEAVVLEAGTLRTLCRLPLEGAACGACFFAESIIALYAAGEYEQSAVVVAFDEKGQRKPWAALPGQPGALAACDGGVLVGHLGWLTMLDAPNGRVRWQTRVRGLPTQIVPLGRVAGFADALDGLVGIVDLRRGTVLRRVRVKEPTGMVWI